MAIYHRRLPIEYQEIEYIESSGTQYINTGVIPTLDTTKLVFDGYSSTNTSSFGVSRTIDSTNYWFTLTGTGGKYRFDYEHSLYTTNIDIGTTRHLFVLDKNNCYVDNVLLNTFTISSRNLISIYLFGRNADYVLNDAGTTRCYSCKIYNNDILVRNFIPCYRKADNVIGLYDLVNDVFYTNAGSGTFSKGDDKLAKVVDIYKGTTQILRKYKGTNLFYNRLPSEFQQVEYIQSSGTQYINSGYNATSSGQNLIQIRADASFYTLPSDVNSYICGCYNSSQRIGIFVSSINNYFRFSSGIVIQTSVEKDTNRHTFYLNGVNKKWYIDNINGDLSPSTSIGSGSEIYIFAYKGSQIAETLGFIKLYSMKIYDNSVLVRNFIPCYRKADNVIGLYDIKNDVFYTNAGTGTFIKGGNI